MSEVSQELLTGWARSCLHMQHLGTLIRRELPPTEKNARALDLADRIERRAWTLFNELIEHGAKKPDGYQEPAQGI
jgi:hypothetical protein